MKTFLVRGGDIHLGPTGFEMCNGQQKLKQDLAMAMIEPLGTDRFHPRWGSLFASYIGAAFAPEAKAIIQSEANRILANTRAMVLREIERDSLSAHKSRYTDDEVIGSVDLIEIRIKLDAVFVRVWLTTRSGQQFAFVRQVEA